MARLTEQEQQEIVRFLEADKPLPDKYRFLLFADKREVELVWNGKTSEVCNIVLPFQVIEQVDEPRAEKPEDTKRKDKDQGLLFSLDERGRQLKGWTNKLIWGDNKLILSSLKNGPLREEIEKQGGLKLIYIDPPFDVGADFSMDIEIGDDTFTKKPNILEEIAYRDTWGKGADSFIAMIYERLILMRDLLAEDGSIYVHIGPAVNHYIRAALDEVFSLPCFRNEIVWRRHGAHNDANQYGVVHESILFYTKSDVWTFNPVFTEYGDEYIDERFRMVEEGTGRRFWANTLTAKGAGPARNIGGKMLSPPTGRHWAFDQAGIDRLLAENRICGRNYRQQKGLRPFVGLQTGRIRRAWGDSKPLEFEGFRIVADSPQLEWEFSMRKNLEVKGTSVRILTREQSDYISLTDMAQYKEPDRTDHVIQNWMRNRNTVEFLGIWEHLNNPDFKPLEFEGFRKKAGLNSFVLTPKQWIVETNAIGIVSTQGRYGGTYAHTDIAFEFASWISVEFKLYLIKEFQRLKEDERKQLGWDIRRNLAKINYRIHTDAIKENLIPPELTAQQMNLIYASEADVLNMALFGMTARQWRDSHPGEKGNIRDYANVSQLVCLSNLENLNALFIQEQMPQAQRLRKLNQIAIQQMRLLLDDTRVKRLEAGDK